MSITVYPITNFVAEVGDLDLSQPLSRSNYSHLVELLKQYSVLIFPEQQLTQEQHIEFSKNFGTLDHSIEKNLQNAAPRIRDELADVSNITGDHIWQIDSPRRKIILANRLWHTDSSFKPQAAHLTMLYARSIPPVGGHTEFADSAAAFCDLDSSLKEKLRTMTADHSFLNSRNKMGFYTFSQQEADTLPSVQHPLVLTDAISGQDSLYVSSHAGYIIDMPKQQGKDLLDQLITHATQRQYVYTHRWRKNDLVLWNNFTTMHRGTEFDDLRWPRDFQRATVIAN